MSAAAPFEYREWPDAAEVVGESAVKFTLHYQGDLPACTQSDTRRREKHALREAFRPQLARLWRDEPILATQLRKDDALGGLCAFGYKAGMPDSLAATTPMHAVEWIHDVENHWFLPLVTKHNGLGCRLDIKFMRPGRVGGVLRSGDLDNRLKTLFDGLRMPHNSSEVPNPMSLVGQPSELFHCLLEDDSLITSVCIATETLLTPTTNRDSEVRLDIGVTLHVVAPYGINRDYGA